MTYNWSPVAVVTHSYNGVWYVIFNGAGKTTNFRRVLTHPAGASVFCSIFEGCQYIVQGFTIGVNGKIVFEVSHLYVLLH